MGSDDRARNPVTRKEMGISTALEARRAWTVTKYATIISSIGNQVYIELRVHQKVIQGTFGDIGVKSQLLMLAPHA